MDVLVSTAYWPNLHYFYFLLNAGSIILEQHEHYQKQSFRNRASILTANGPLDLVIPVKKKSNCKEIISTIQISYSEAWQKKHWRAITSAYKNSPYFEYFEDELKQFYDTEYDLLLNYNTEQLRTMFRILRLRKEVQLTGSNEKNRINTLDLRNDIHPKETMTYSAENTFLNNPYYQTFGDKFGFTPNLSILDLLFNKGLASLDYFPKETLTL